ncbi:MAG: hypothetical protein ACRDTD_30245, partial [Pseudonocardiaceae bacterium]
PTSSPAVGGQLPGTGIVEVASQDQEWVRQSKLLLSCRTRYFRTIRHETTHFTGQHRDGPVTVDYLALLMLPFGEEQVRAYLTANLPGADVDRLLDLIDSLRACGQGSGRRLNLRNLISRGLSHYSGTWVLAT